MSTSRQSWPPAYVQYEQPLRAVAFNPIEGWSRDATEDIARELVNAIILNRAVERGNQMNRFKNS